MPRGQPSAKVRLQISRIPGNNNEILVKPLIELQNTNESEVAPPKEVIFIIDRSGSMSEQNRLTIAKNALAGVWARLRPEDSYTIITYNGTAQTIRPSKKKSACQGIRSEISGIKSDGITSFTAAFRQIAPINNGRQSVIFLLTDGEDSHYGRDPEGLTAEISSILRDKYPAGSQPRIIPVGIGSGYNVGVMLKIAELSGFDQNFDITNEHELDDKCLQIAEEMREIVPEEISFSLELSSTKTVVNLGRISVGVASGKVVKMALPRAQHDRNLRLKGYTGRQERLAQTYAIGDITSIPYDEALLAQDLSEQVKRSMLTSGRDYASLVELKGSLNQLKQVVEGYIQAIHGISDCHQGTIAAYDLGDSPLVNLHQLLTQTLESLNNPSQFNSSVSSISRTTSSSYNPTRSHVAARGLEKMGVAVCRENKVVTLDAGTPYAVNYRYTDSSLNWVSHNIEQPIIHVDAEIYRSNRDEIPVVSVRLKQKSLTQNQLPKAQLEALVSNARNEFSSYKKGPELHKQEREYLHRSEARSSSQSASSSQPSSSQAAPRDKLSLPIVDLCEYEATKYGDCKHRALWLCRELASQLNAGSVQMYRGTANNGQAHAWVVYRPDNSDAVYVLEPSLDRLDDSARVYDIKNIQELKELVDLHQFNYLDGLLAPFLAEEGIYDIPTATDPRVYIPPRVSTDRVYTVFQQRGLICPIACDIPDEPVYLQVSDAQGQVKRFLFDRACLESWLAVKQTNPSTNEVLQPGSYQILPAYDKQNEIYALLFRFFGFYKPELCGGRQRINARDAVIQSVDGLPTTTMTPLSSEGEWSNDNPVSQPEISASFKFALIAAVAGGVALLIVGIALSLCLPTVIPGAILIAGGASLLIGAGFFGVCRSGGACGGNGDQENHPPLGMS